MPISWGDVDWFNLGKAAMEMEPLPLTADDTGNIQAVQTMLDLARDQKPHKREAFYKAAGQHLEMLRRGKPVEVWAELCRTHLGLGLSRCYELVALGMGKRLVDLRKQKAGSGKTSRALAQGNPEIG